MLSRYYLNLRSNYLFNIIRQSNQSTQAAVAIPPTATTLKHNMQKLKSLPVEIKLEYLDAATVNRLAQCSPEFVTDMVKGLKEYDFDDKELARTLKNYDDWSVLTCKNFREMNQIFRELSLRSSLFRAVFSSNQNILNFDQSFLAHRLFKLKNFLTNKHLERVLPRSPQILTDNFDHFKYKFVYMYILMGVRQNEMVASNVFNYSMRHIRERHLFLMRSLFYDKPSKKGNTKVENPALNLIMDTSVKEFLQKCTNNMFNESDFNIFCEYLSEEFVDNELLGNRLDRSLRNQILAAIKEEKTIRYLKDSDENE